jgi:hypothetical protein
VMAIVKAQRRFFPNIVALILTGSLPDGHNKATSGVIRPCDSCQEMLCNDRDMPAVNDETVIISTNQDFSTAAIYNRLELNNYHAGGLAAGRQLATYRSEHLGPEEDTRFTAKLAEFVLGSNQLRSRTG